MIKASSEKEDITVLNFYISGNRALKFHERKTDTTARTNRQIHNYYQ